MGRIRGKGGRYSSGRAFPVWVKLGAWPDTLMGQLGGATRGGCVLVPKEREKLGVGRHVETIIWGTKGTPVGEQGTPRREKSAAAREGVRSHAAVLSVAPAVMAIGDMSTGGEGGNGRADDGAAD